MDLRKIAENNYYRFCRLEGHDYIASEYALYRLLKIIRKFKVKSILEVGLGIGSISDTILKYHDGVELNYTGTEANEFCKSVLEYNVKFFERIELFKRIVEIPEGRKFDLIIVDGQDETFFKLKSLCENKCIIFIEGDRSPQAEQVLSMFPGAKQVQLISLKKNKAYSTGSTSSFVGGGRLIFINPNLVMRVYWLRERVFTYIKRYLRNYL